MKNYENEKAFFERIAALLETHHEYRRVAIYPKVDRHTGEIYVPITENTRWHRALGNGRFPGHGVIRYWKPDSIQVLFNNPIVRATYTSEEDAIAAIQQAVENSNVG
jgi:hypothetical protein